MIFGKYKDGKLVSDIRDSLGVAEFLIRNYQSIFSTVLMASEEALRKQIRDAMKKLEEWNKEEEYLRELLIL